MVMEYKVIRQKWCKHTGLCIEYITEPVVEAIDETLGVVEYNKKVAKSKQFTECVHYEKYNDIHILFLEIPLLNIGDDVYADGIFKGHVFHLFQTAGYYKYMIGGAYKNDMAASKTIKRGAKITKQ